MNHVFKLVVLPAMLVAFRAQAQDLQNENAAEIPSEPPPLAEENPIREHKFGFAGELSAGYARHEIFDIGMNGVDVQVAAGFRYKTHFALLEEVHLQLGSTTGGLGYQSLLFGTRVEFVLDRLHLGLGIQASALWINSITRPSDSNSDFGLGVFAMASFELVKFGDHGLFLAARFDVSRYLLGGETPGVWGPTVSVGFRY